MLHGLGSSRGLQQSHRAATKATACHAAAVNPRCRQRSLHQLIQLRAAHLVVIPAESKKTGEEGLGPAPPQPWGCPVLGPTGASPEGLVAVHHEAAEGSIVTPVEGSCCLGRAPNLPYDVPCPPEAFLAHQLSASWGGVGSVVTCRRGGTGHHGSRALGEPPLETGL